MNRLVLIVMLFVLCAVASAQGTKAKPSKSPGGTAPPATAGQPNDKEYTDSILKNTSEKFFLT